MSYSCNDNQNYFVQNGRTTSRVTNLPGGRSSVSLAWDEGNHNKENATRQNVETGGRVSYILKKKAQMEVSDKIGSDEPTTTYTIGKQHPTTSTITDSVLAGGAAPVSSNAFASGSNMNSGNVMTGRSSTKIQAPPGGTSSIRFC